MKKIAITGPESSGKTTLARLVAAFFSAPCVPEYARIFLHLLGRPYGQSDLPAIAAGQARWEDALAALQPPLLVCDTDILVIKVWAEYKYGACPPSISALWQQKRYDLHLLCRPDMPWQYDPLREHPDKREDLYPIYLEELQSAGLPFIEVGGSEMERLRTAVALIQSGFLLINDF